MPTYNCNLRCHYCFQDHMRSKPEFRHLLKRMSKTMVDRIFAAIPKLEEQHGLSLPEGATRSYTLFGGEPLLAANRELVAHILASARALGGVRMSAVSNATELQAHEDLLGPEGISSVQITFDGPSAEHDKRRIYADGSGSFAKIAGNIDMALARGVKIDSRVNLDRNNIRDLPQLVDEIIAHGWNEHPGFSIYAAPIRSEHKSPEIMNAWDLTKAMRELEEEFPRVAMVRKPDTGLLNRAIEMFSKPGEIAMSPKASFCGAHNSMYIFDGLGDIYACWEKTGDERLKIGSLSEDGGLHFRIPRNIEWRTRTVTSNPVCGKCRYSLNCGGGCAVLAEARWGKLHANFCDGYAARFRSTMAEAYAIANQAAPAEPVSAEPALSEAAG
jgi:uncharacterized protein